MGPINNYNPLLTEDEYNRVLNGEGVGFEMGPEEDQDSKQTQSLYDEQFYMLIDQGLNSRQARRQLKKNKKKQDTENRRKLTI